MTIIKVYSTLTIFLIFLFWASLYNTAIFVIFGGITGQITLLAVWFISLLLINRKHLKFALENIACHSVEIIFLSTFAIINLIYLLISYGDFAYEYFVRVLLLLVLHLTIIIHLKRNILLFNQLVSFIIVLFGSISFYVIPILFNNPFIARFNEFSDGELPWFGSWSFFMPLAISMPCFVTVANNQKNKIFRRLLYILCLLICIMIIFSTFAASIILLLLGIFIMFLLNLKNKRKFVIISMSILTVFILLLNVNDFDELPQIGKMVEKIGTIFNFSKDLGGDDNDPRIRASLVQTSINSFIHNPFFGVGLYGPSDKGYTLIGMHSGFLDSLAQYGLFGIIWFFCFLFIGFRRLLLIMSRRKYDHLNNARFVTFILYIIGSLANPVLTETTFCTLVFLLALSPIENNVLEKNKNLSIT